MRDQPSEELRGKPLDRRAGTLGRQGGSMQANISGYPAMNWPRRYVLLAVIWSVLVVGSLVWDMYTERQSTLRTATAAALASINKDISFRKWANSHGGVYVPPTEHTPPNPYLKAPDRDVVTTTGKALTLMNPAYVLREMQTDFPDDYGTKSHITSLKLLNPKNAPDDWEAKALRSFERGEKELLETQQIDGQPYLRLMRPFFVDQGCLKCHAQQGYKVGDIRGGISTAISLEPYLAREREFSANMALSHGTIWLLGLAGLGISYRRDRRQADERERAANDLRASENQLRLLLDSAAEAIYGIDMHGNGTFCNSSCLRMLGYRHADELIGKNMHDLIHYRHKDGTLFPVQDCRIYRAFLTGQNSHVDDEVLWRADGTCFPAEYWSYPQIIDGKVVGAVVSFMDITERKLAEEQIRRSEHSLSEAQRIAHLGSWNLDIVKNVLTWSDEIYRIFEIDPEKFGATYDAFLDAIHPDDRDLVNNAYTESVRNKRPYNIAHRLLMKDGRVKYVNEVCETSYGEDGTPLRSFGIVHDITERKQAEEKLRVASLYARSLIEASLDPLVTISPEGGITDVNKATEEAAGLPRNELIGTDFADYFTDVEKARAGYKQVLSQGFVRDYPLTLRHNSGRTMNVLYNATVYRDEAGNIQGVFAAARDVTERKLAENELWEKEERLALATLHNGVGIWDWNLITQEMIWDDSMYSLYHIRREDFIGTEEAWRAALHPDDLERGDREVNDAISGKKPFDTEFRVVWPNGEIHHIKAVAKVFRDGQGTPLRMLGINMDITELRQTSIALQEKTSLLRNIIDSSSDYIFAKDRELRTILCNEVFARAVGKHVGDIIGKTDIENGWDPVLVKGDAARGIRGYEQDDLDATAGKTIRSVDQLYVGGELHYVDTVKLPLRDDAGRTLGMFGISRDITASKLRENIQMARLRLTDYAANHTLKELLVATLDEACALTGSSIGFYHFLDADQKTLSLQAWSTRTTKEFCKAAGEGSHYGIDQAGVWVDCVRERRPVIHNDYAALPNKRGMPPGHAHVEREMVVPIFRNELIVAILGVGNKAAPYKDNDLDSVTQLADLAWDIAVAKRASEEVRRLNAELEQRVMERTAQLEAANRDMEGFSYSVSHDLRSPLRAIDGFSRILLEDYAARLDDEGKRLLHVVGDNAQKMGDLIDDILAFSRTTRQEVTRSEIDMTELVREIMDELKPDAAGRELKLELKVLPPARADRSMLHQVLLNLLGNAIKFTRHKTPARIEVGARSEGDEIVYYVKDNGVGFDMQYVGKLFGVFHRLHGQDEFEGTGIGLAIVKRIITKHGGRVWAEGKPNEGATVYFTLPAKGE